MTATRILVVDDSVVVRRLLSQVLSEHPELEVVGTAANGRIALQKLEQTSPDVVVLDLEMPEMNGLECLEALRAERPKLPVVMYSTLTRRGALATLDALALGATDYATKPEAGSTDEAMAQVRDTLVPKLLALSPRRPILPVPPPLPTPVAPGRAPSRPVELVVIGCSTGGPNALAEVMPRLPGDLAAPILIVQHMPPMFTRLLAERLSRLSAFDVREAESGAMLSPGRALVAPGDHHMVVRRGDGRLSVALNQGPPENSCRPAVDVLFRSAAERVGAGVLGVVLTGMGRDGQVGAKAISEAGGRILVQDATTSVVWGMPGFVVEAGLADEVLPIGEIGPAIARHVAASHAVGPGRSDPPPATGALRAGK